MGYLYLFLVCVFRLLYVLYCRIASNSANLEYIPSALLGSDQSSAGAVRQTVDRRPPGAFPVAGPTLFGTELSMGPFRVTQPNPTHCKWKNLDPTQPNPIQLTMELTVW